MDRKACGMDKVHRIFIGDSRDHFPSNHAVADTETVINARRDFSEKATLSTL